MQIDSLSGSFEGDFHEGMVGQRPSSEFKALDCSALNCYTDIDIGLQVVVAAM